MPLLQDIRQRFGELCKPRRYVRVRVDPMLAPEEIEIFIGKRHLLDSERDDDLFPVKRKRDLIAHMAGDVGMRRRQQHKSAAAADRLHDLRRIVFSGMYVPGRDPATEPRALDMSAYICGDLAVF